MLLILMSFFILGIEYDIFNYKSLNVTAFILTINEFKVNKPNIFRFLSVIIILFAIFHQGRWLRKDIILKYSEGYKNLSLVKYVANYISEVCGHNANGAPFGNLKPGLFNQQIKPGRFSTQSGRLSDELSIILPRMIHFKSVISGLFKVLTSRSAVFGLIPVILGLWSIVVIII